MNFLELAKNRYSCRGFKSVPVEQEKIDKILEAAQAAPTACNFQPQRVYVIKSAEALAKINECTRFSFDAPLNFLICYDKTKSWHRRKDNLDHGPVDAAIVQTHMMLMAADLGLGTTWVCAFDEEKARGAFNIPENYVIMGFMPTGYPDMQPSDAHEKRMSITEFIEEV